MAGEIVDPLGAFQIRPANGLGEFEIARAGTDESGHVTATTEDLAEIVAVGADIKSLGAVDAKTDDGEGNLEDFMPVDAQIGRAHV